MNTKKSLRAGITEMVKKIPLYTIRRNWQIGKLDYNDAIDLIILQWHVSAFTANEWLRL